MQQTLDEKLKRLHGAGNKNQQSPTNGQKHISMVKLSDNLILSTNDNGTETLRIGLSVQDRKTREWKTIETKFPSLENWDSYCLELAEFYDKLSTDFGDLYIPDEIEELYEQGVYQVYAAITSHVFKIKPFRDFIIGIFLRYLDPFIEGVSNNENSENPQKDTERWIKKNTGMDDAFTIFTAVMAVEDYLKKKALIPYQKMTGISKRTQLQSSPISPKNPGNQSENSKSGVFLEPAVFS